MGPRTRPAFALACLLFVALGNTGRGEAPRIFEAEDSRFVLLKGDWQRLDEKEAREGGVAGVASSAPGASLRFDFTGSSVALRCHFGPLVRRVRTCANPRLFDWRTFTAARVAVSIDGARRKEIDLAAARGWGDVVAAEGLAETSHTLSIEVRSGTFFVDRFAVGGKSFARVSVRVSDEGGRPVPDALVEFRRGGPPVAVLRTHRDGSTGLVCTVPPGTYTVIIAPDDSDGSRNGTGIVDDPRLPGILTGVKVEAGKRKDLTVRLSYRDDTARPCGNVLRPALGYPVIRRPGESFPLILRAEPKRPIQVRIVSAEGGLVSLPVGPVAESPFGPFCPVSIPESVRPGAYGLSVAGDGWKEELPSSLFIRRAIPRDYTIAHISDTHVKNLRSDWGAFRALTAIAADVGEGPAFAVITGDLTDNGVPSQFLRFRRALAAFRLPVFVCEGNHDNFDGGRFRFYRGRVAFRRYMGLKAYPIRFGPDRFAVLGTGLYEPIHPDQIRWAVPFLDEETSGLKGFFLHYDYTERLPPGKTSIPGNQVGHLAARLGVTLVLEGHLHMPRTRRLATAVAIMAPAAKDGRYSLIKIKNGSVGAVFLRSVDLPGRKAPELRGGAGRPPRELEGLLKVKALFTRGGDRSSLEWELRSAPDWRMRFAAAQIIARSGFAREARAALAAALSDPNPCVREEAALAMGTDTVVTPLRKALADDDPRVRRAAVKALKLVRGRSALRALAETLDDADVGVALCAASVLGDFRLKGMVGELRRHLRNRNLAARVKRNLIGSLEAHDDREALPDLLAALRDADLDVRAEAALLLGRWKVWKAIPELIRLLEEGMDAQQVEAHRILVRLAKVDFSFGSAVAREKWEAWWGEKGRRKGGE